MIYTSYLFLQLRELEIIASRLCFFPYAKQNLSNMGSLNWDFQKQKHKYCAAVAKTINTGNPGSGLTASRLSLACPHTFTGSQPVLQVPGNESQGKSEILNTKT